MAVYLNTFEGGTDGASITLSGSGGASGTAFSAIVANTVAVSSSPNIIYSSAAALSGNLGCRMTLDVGQSYLLLNASATMTSRVYVRLKVRYPGPATSSVNPFTTLLANATGAAGRPAAITVGSDGRPFLAVTDVWYNGGASQPDSRPSTALTAGAIYTFILIVGKSSAAGNTDGELGFRILDSGGNVVHTWTGTANTGVNDFTGARFGGATNANGWATVDMDNVELGDVASGWPPGSGGTNVVVTSNSYLVADFTGSTSGASNVLSFSIAFTSGQNNSSGIKQPVSGLFLIPRGTADSVYTVTINDGGTLTTQTVSVPAEGTATAIDGIVEYTWDGSSWL